MFFRSIVSACLVALFSVAPPAQAQSHRDDTIECRSSGHKYAECEAPFRHPRLVKQLSDSECVENKSWGYKRESHSIWVSDGCTAVFADSEDHDSRDSSRDRDDRRDREDNHADSHDRADDRRDRGRQAEVIECRSRDYSLTRCDTNWDRARLVEQLSGTRCVEGENWGIDEHRLWVDKGCGGRFTGR
jgi:hypothetical protein